MEGNFTGAFGSWHVEQSASTTLQNHESTWIGIGGGEFDPSYPGLIQEGTAMGTGLGYYSWFEFICATCSGAQYNEQKGSAYGVTFTNGDVVRPTDLMAGAVYWQSRTEACFILDDDSRSSGSLSGCVTNLGAVSYDTNGIEWINEKQPGQALSDFGVTNWTDQESYNPSSSTYTPFTSLNFFSYVLTENGVKGPLPPCSSSSSLLAYAENASSSNSGSSDTRWCHWGS